MTVAEERRTGRRMPFFSPIVRPKRGRGGLKKKQDSQTGVRIWGGEEKN